MNCHRLTRYALIHLLALTALLPNVSATAQAMDIAALQARLQQLEAENTALKAELAELKKQLNISEETNQTLQEEKQELEVLAGLPQKEDVPHARVSSSFASGVTTVSAEPLTIPESTKLLEVVHRFGAAFQYPGESPTGVIDQAEIVVTTLANTKDSYRRLKTITLIAGDQAFSLPVSDYEILHQERTGGRTKMTRYDEAIKATVTYDQLRTMAIKSPLRLEIGRRDFTLTHDHEALLDAVAERMRQTGAQSTSGE